jgi:predicted nucleic acid-binding protein
LIYYLSTAPLCSGFAHIRGNLRQQGLIIGDFDILIGATALHHNLTLVTRNRKHYERIPGLNIHPPEAKKPQPS